MRWRPSVCRCWPTSRAARRNLGKTGGYAIGYILAALLTALLTKALGRKFWSLCVAMVVGCAACYVLGTIWFMILTGADLVSALG